MPIPCRRDPDPAELLRAAVATARHAGTTADLLDPLTAALALRCPELDLPGLHEQLAGAIRGLWDRGWQPADVVHVVGRRTSRRAARRAAAGGRAAARAR
ncbi:hypothetical protein, partial [Klenkia sp. PcliD-1-E]|uniref:hypothetical protein n=1 Tax=Klenkia sp. PcliD-1-E TaxID=2954492 RepID=UPI0020969C2A